MHGAVENIRDHEDFDDATEPTRARCVQRGKWKTSLLFLVSLMHLKVMNHWANKSFIELLQLLRKSHPANNQIQEKHYEAKAKLKRFGMG